MILPQEEIKAVQAELFEALKLIDRVADTLEEQPGHLAGKPLRSGRRLLDTLAFALSIGLHQEKLRKEGYPIDARGLTRASQDVVGLFETALQHLGDDDASGELIARAVIMLTCSAMVLNGIPRHVIGDVIAKARDH